MLIFIDFFWLSLTFFDCSISQSDKFHHHSCLVVQPQVSRRNYGNEFPRAALNYYASQCVSASARTHWRRARDPVECSLFLCLLYVISTRVKKKTQEKISKNPRPVGCTLLVECLSEGFECFSTKKLPIKNGDRNVPYHYARKPKLSLWVKRQRYSSLQYSATLVSELLLFFDLLLHTRNAYIYLLTIIEIDSWIDVLNFPCLQLWSNKITRYFRFDRIP